MKGNSAFFCQRGKICEDFLHHRPQLHRFIPGHLLQAAHFQQGLCHLGQPLCLLLQKPEKLRRFRQHIGMLGAEQLQLGLHQRQRCAQLVGSISRELLLGDKGVVQPIQHLIEGAAQLPQLRQHILMDLHIRQVVQLHLLHLGGKAVQRPEGAAADKIGKDPGKYRHRRRNVPAGDAEGFLGTVDDDRQILPTAHSIGVKKGRFSTDSAALQRGSNGTHIVHTGRTDQQLHADAGDADEGNAHQGDAPLQRDLFHSGCPPMRYPSPIRLRMGS